MANTSAAAYTQLKKVDNPVGDSMKYWGGIMSKQSDELNRDNQRQREAMIKEHQDWATKNALTPEMLQIMATTNPDYDKQGYAYADQVKQEYIKAYNEADAAQRSGDFKKATSLTNDMKLMLNGFKQVNNIGEIIKAKGEEFKKVLTDPNKYDTHLNRDLEDLYKAAFDTKNMTIAMDPTTKTPMAVYPSSDGSFRKLSLAAIQSGQVFNYVPEVDGYSAVQSVVSKIAEDKNVTSSGLFKNTSILWDEQKQKTVEDVMFNKFNDFEFKNLYRKYVDPEYRDYEGFLTDEQKREVAKAMTKDAEVYYKQEVSKEYDSSAVSRANNIDTNATNTASNIRTTNASRANTKDNNATSIRVAEIGKSAKSTASHGTVVQPVNLTVKGKTVGKAVSLGLNKPVTVAVKSKDGEIINLETSDIRVIKGKNGIYQYQALSDDNQYHTVNNVGDIFKATGAKGDALDELKQNIYNGLK